MKKKTRIESNKGDQTLEKTPFTAYAWYQKKEWQRKHVGYKSRENWDRRDRSDNIQRLHLQQQAFVFLNYGKFTSKINTSVMH